MCLRGGDQQLGAEVVHGILTEYRIFISSSTSRAWSHHDAYQQLDGAIHGSPDSPYAYLQPGADLVAMASLSDNVVDAYRCIAPHVRPGDEVLVIGSASIGLYAVAVAGALGAPCTYVDSVDARLRVAERLGAKVISSVPDGKSFGEFAVTASCNSTPGGLQSAIRSTAGGGICQAAGIHFRPVDLPLVEMYRRGIRLETGRASARDQLPAVLDLIQQKRLRPGEIGATVIDVADAPKALRGPLSHKTIIKMV